MARQVRIEILADDRQVGRALGRTEQRFKGFSSNIGRLGGALAGAFAGVAVIEGIKGFVAAARDAELTAKQTAAVIKSTGGAAKLSAQGFADLAASISKKVAVDDDVIQSGENILATFTGIRNEVGKGNDIFNQATVAAVDLTAAMNHGQVTAEGLKGANIQLGKALQDPVKGIAALTRVGVAFDAGQKAQIKSLVEHGDKLGAQKIILAELSKEFGGAAASQATASKRLGVAWGNIQEQLGGVLIPILDKVATWLAARLPAAVDRTMGVLRTLGTGIKALSGAFGEGDVTSTGFVGGMERIGVAARAVADWFSTRVLPAVRTVLPYLQQMATSVGTALAGAFRSIQPGLKSLWSGLERLWPVVKVLITVWAAYVFILWSKVIPVLIRLAGPVLGALFKTLGLLISWIANVLRWIGLGIAALLRWSSGTKSTADAIKVHGARISREFQVMGNAVRVMWEQVIRPVFAAMVTVWLRSVGMIIGGAARAFGWVPGIGGKLRTAAAEFHKFSDRVIAELNRPRDKTVTITAKAVVTGTPAVIREGVRVGLLVGRAHGGGVFGPGTGTSDSIPAMLSNNEHVVTAREVAGAGGHAAVERQREIWRGAGGVAGFASGGAVNVRVVDATNHGAFAAGVSRPVQIAERISASLAERVARSAASAFIKAYQASLGGGATAGGLAAIKAFIRSTDSHPYRWGGVGPGGYDCSGLTGEVFARHKGKRSFRRYFTTASNFGALGFRPGSGGTYTIGVTPGHHMAGEYGGLKFEARSTRSGIFVGPSARSVSSFPRRFHMAAGGPVLEALARAYGLIDIGGDEAGMRIGIGRKLDMRSFDAGGFLPPHSWTLAHNGTGRYEPVGRGGTVTIEKGAVQINVYASPGQSERQLVDLMEQRERAVFASILGPVVAHRAG